MKPYLSLIRIRFSTGLQYRSAAYAGIATQFAWGFMYLLMYSAFYRANSAAVPMKFEQLSSYIWLHQAFFTLFAAWVWDSDIFTSITSGNIAYELARPVDLYAMWFMKNLATRASRAFIRCMPILLVAVFLPKPYSLSLPTDLPNFLIFILSFVLAFLTVNAFGMLVYIATFYTLSPLGLRMIAATLSDFLSGALIPLPFLPNGIRRVLELTPFATMQNLPFRIYSGNIAGNELLFNIALQLFWLLTLVIFGKIWMDRAVSKVVIQGG